MSKSTRKLVLGTCVTSRIPETEEIKRIAAAGWDGVFTCWDAGRMLPAKQIADAGLYYQSVHAPFGEVYKLWEENEAGDIEAEEQIRCIRESAEAGVNLVIMHAIIGMDRHTPTQIGIDRFGYIFDKAKEYGVRVALENTEGQIYLDTLLNAFKGEKNVGFCVDTGHEQCYNGGADFISKYGDRLFCTHLNDNMGQTGEKITWLDDSHMLPFDGIIDWQKTAERLNKVGYCGDFTFEIIEASRPERHTHDIYSSLDYDSFIALAFEKAKRFAEMIK